MPRRTTRAKKQPTVAEVIQVDLLVASLIRVVGIEKVKAESMKVLSEMAAGQKKAAKGG